MKFCMPILLVKFTETAQTQGKVNGNKYYTTHSLNLGEVELISTHVEFNDQVNTTGLQNLILVGRLFVVQKNQNSSGKIPLNFLISVSTNID